MQNAIQTQRNICMLVCVSFTLMLGIHQFKRVWYLILRKCYSECIYQTMIVLYYVLDITHYYRFYNSHMNSIPKNVFSFDIVKKLHILSKISRNENTWMNEKNSVFFTGRVVAMKRILFVREKRFVYILFSLQPNSNYDGISTWKTEIESNELKLP